MSAATPQPLSTPAAAAAIITDLTDPAASLHDIAARHKTTIEQLTLFITRPDIAERLETLHTAAASRARLLATSFLNKAIATLVRVMDSATSESQQAHTNTSASSHPTSEIRHQTSLESARRAASRLISLANFRPIPLFTRPEPRATTLDTNLNTSAINRAMGRRNEPVGLTDPAPRTNTGPTQNESSPATHAMAQEVHATAIAQKTLASPTASASSSPLQRASPLVGPPLRAGTTSTKSKPHRPRPPTGRFNGLPTILASAPALLLAAAGTATLDRPHEHWP
jgi:hypothetical protein